MEQTFLNKFIHVVDGQRRVALPKEWRGDGSQALVFYALPGQHAIYHLLPEAVFQRTVIEKIKDSFSFANYEETAALRGIAQRAVKCVCDRQGRMTLDPQILEHTGITDKALLAGGFVEFTLMAPETLEHEKGPLEEKLDRFEQIRKKETS